MNLSDMNVSPVVGALLTLAAGFVVGVTLMWLGLTLIGIIVAMTALPIALIAWVMLGDR
jgi:hypothetical protein